MPKFRTAKKDRTTYIYSDAYGRKAAELKSGEDGVTEALITRLHAEDDAVHNTAKRDNYHGLLHLNQTGFDGDDLLDDRQMDLSNPDANPETLFINTLKAVERSSALKTAWDSLSDKQRELVMKKLLKRTNTDIAREEGCSEAAIRKRLAKIQKHFEFFKKYRVRNRCIFRGSLEGQISSLGKELRNEPKTQSQYQRGPPEPLDLPSHTEQVAELFVRRKSRDFYPNARPKRRIGGNQGVAERR